MASEAERRDKLLGLTNGVRAFFEMTTVAPRAKGHPWSAAFRAVRTNDYMAESFLEELQALLDYIEAAFATAPGRTVRAEVATRDEETRVAPPRGIAQPPARPAAKRSETPRPVPRAQPAPSAPRPAPARAVPPSPPPRPVAAAPREAARPRAMPPPPPRPTAPAQTRPPSPPPRPSAVPARVAPPAARAVAAADDRTSRGNARPAPPSPPPRPRQTRRNQFVDVETTVTAPPSFGLEDAVTGPTDLPNEPPRRRR
jgi:hypothetical protein